MKRKAMGRDRDVGSNNTSTSQVEPTSHNEESGPQSPLVSSSTPTTPTLSSTTPTGSTPLLSRKEVTALRKKARTDEIEKKIRELLESKKRIESGGKVLILYLYR